MLEDYIKKVQIEARIMGDLATTFVLPSAVKYQNVLLTNIKNLKDAGLPESSYANQYQVAERISHYIQQMSDNVEKMIEARKVANEIGDTRERAIAYCENIKGQFFDVIRYHVDKLELIVDDENWLLPKYREMLFLR
jgi:glutamine synthetase